MVLRQQPAAGIRMGSPDPHSTSRAGQHFGGGFIKIGFFPIIIRSCEGWTTYSRIMAMHGEVWTPHQLKIVKSTIFDGCVIFIWGRYLVDTYSFSLDFSLTDAVIRSKYFSSVQRHCIFISTVSFTLSTVSKCHCSELSRSVTRAPSLPCHVSMLVSAAVCVRSHLANIFLVSKYFLGVMLSCWGSGPDWVRLTCWLHWLAWPGAAPTLEPSRRWFGH